MKSIQTTKHTRRGFSVLHRTRSAQAATMTLAPGATSTTPRRPSAALPRRGKLGSSSESSSNEHGWAEQWLYVVSGHGRARVGNRTVKLEPGTLLVIAKHEPHEIKSSARSRLVTVNLYVPAAYDSDGEPLRG
jgi:mannose-6-phosphate isomerase-like protein (cupin superfamily)